MNDWPPLGAPCVYPDLGSAGLYRRLLRLARGHRVLYVTAHPDDEDAATLTYLCRVWGARVHLFTLTRGESGESSIGDEQGECLGLLRAQELMRASAWYGLDGVHAGSFFDYGFSKRIDEAFEHWSEDAVVGEVTRAIRLLRPAVVLSRFSGTPADGHAHHQIAGHAVRVAMERAGERGAHPEHQLEPYAPTGLFLWSEADGPGRATVPVWELVPLLGESAAQIGARGMAEHRSQNLGRLTEPLADARRYYERAEGPPGSASFFEGLPRSGWPACAGRSLSSLESAHARFDPLDPTGVVPLLSDALSAVEEAAGCATTRPEREELSEMSGSISAALAAATGIVLCATATRAGDAPPQRFFDPFETMGPARPGRSFVVDVRWRGPAPTSLELRAPDGCNVVEEAFGRFIVTPGSVAEPVHPRRGRDDAGQWLDRYEPDAVTEAMAPFAAAPLTLVSRHGVADRTIELRCPVESRDPRPPHGRSPLTLAPAVEVSVAPALQLCRPSHPVTVRVRVSSGGDPPPSGARLRVRSGSAAVAVEQVLWPSDVRTVEWVAHLPPLPEGAHRLEADAEVDGGRYDSGVVRVGQLPHQVSAAAIVTVTTAEVTRGGDIVVIPGSGDPTADAVRQLGVACRVMERAIEGSALHGATAILLGVRAYAIRHDLTAATEVLLDAARRGAHVIVFAQTSGYDPGKHGPYPATLPPSPEEVCEHRAPVQLVASDHPLLTAPNRIGESDFADWVEQRASKLWSWWDGRYAALIETHDRDQGPQRGVWLSAPVGKGRYTYCALALDRQLRAGVPGAFRILANLVSAR